MPLAFANASSSEPKPSTQTTGPKTSFWTISESWAAPVITVGG